MKFGLNIEHLPDGIAGALGSGLHRMLVGSTDGRQWANIKKDGYEEDLREFFGYVNEDPINCYSFSIPGDVSHRVFAFARVDGKPFEPSDVNSCKKIAQMMYYCNKSHMQELWEINPSEEEALRPAAEETEYPPPTRLMMQHYKTIGWMFYPMTDKYSEILFDTENDAKFMGAESVAI